MIRDASLKDAKSICGIYNHYVRESCISFEEEPVSAREMRGRIAEYSKAFPWLVCEVDGKLLGYSYASKWRARTAYRHSVETTVYVDKDAKSKGIGSALYAELIGRLRRQGLHALMAGIALPNDASQRLHEKFGFKKVAHLSEIGWKLGRWVDVGYWELLLDADRPEE
jgi:L-amino acid N-acyltransferase YncA